MKSFSTPTTEQLDAALPLLSSPQHEAYFFGKLENPNWIVPLSNRDVFKYPPRAQRVDGGGIRFPYWPPSKYLARMATSAPAEVAAIFARIETDNASILGDLLDAAAAIPAELAESLVPAVCRAARSEALWIYFQNASDLCARLAEAGKLDAATMLADVLFTPDFEVGQEVPSRREEYWYRDGLGKVVPPLARAGAKQFLPKLCDWLNASVEAKEHVDPKTGYDYSYGWRPAIEEHQQNRNYDFAGAMVGFVREGFEVAVRAKTISLQGALQIIEPYPLLVFKRIRLHLIGEFADQTPDLVRHTILNRELFDDYEYKHEYAMLVGRRLDMLSAGEREEWFGLIDAGPDLSRFNELIRESEGREGTEDERKKRIEYWQFEKLHWVRAHLEGKRREFYQRMLSAQGEPELADLNIATRRMRFGSESPFTVDELSTMSFENVVEAVSTWQPEGSRFMGPNVEGLASTFSKFVATDLERFSHEAEQLIGRPAIFVRRFISRMSEAVKSGLDIDLTAVVKLCQWVVSRPLDERTTAEQEHEVLVDEDWQWTRNEISGFIENICEAKAGDSPKHKLEDHRQAIWGLLEALCKDPTGSNILLDTSKMDFRVHDFLDLGTNAPQGKAVEAALQYARWVANQIKTSEGKQEIVPGGFDRMPEVRDMLQRLIGAESRSLETLAVIGSRISLIYWIDKKWLTEHVEQMFQLELIAKEPSAADGWAAWNAFLVWVSPHIAFYSILKSQYSYAVEQSAIVELPKHAHDQPMQDLGEHLMQLYGRGQLSLDDDQGLIRRFLDTANPDIRRHAIGFVGRTLEFDDEPKKQLPEEVIQRFATLWDVYWSGKGPADAAERPEEWLFGTWYTSGQFPADWALDRLERFVGVSALPQPIEMIAEQLVKDAPVDPAKTVRILDKIVRGDGEGWRIRGSLDSAEEILKTALAADSESNKIAVELMDHLGRCGYTEFGSLLK